MNLNVQYSYTDVKNRGTLFLVPTPIGNLDDITLRSLKVLKSVDLIAAEDTRTTQKLLNHYQIKTQQISFHEHNKLEKIPIIIQKLLEGISVAQVSDAGMPSISDPGKELVLEAIHHEINVVPLPGANAALTGLIASGCLPQPFYFYGFLPRKNKEQIKVFDKVKSIFGTIIFYESPYRLVNTLENINKIFNNPNVALCKELTKKFETFIRGSLDEVLEWCKGNDKIKGEFVILIDNQTLIVPEGDNDIPINTLVDNLISKGIRPNDAIKKVSKIKGLSKKIVYNFYHNIN